MLIDHHALLIRSCDGDLRSLLSKWSVDTTAEVSQFVTERFGIAEVRSLAEYAYRRPAKDAGYRLLVVSVKQITLEAQHALLKILEEPPRTTRFLFVLPNQVTLIPTVLSRFFEISSTLPEAEVSISAWQEFITAPPARRLSLISDQLAKTGSAWQEGILTGMRQHIASLPPATLNRALLVKLISLIGTRGAANKMLFEEAALTLPVES